MKGGEEKGGDVKGGEEKGGDVKGGEEKGGDVKGGEEKGGDEKSKGKCVVKEVIAHVGDIIECLETKGFCGRFESEEEKVRNCGDIQYVSDGVASKISTQDEKKPDWDAITSFSRSPLSIYFMKIDDLMEESVGEEELHLRNGVE